MKETKKSAPVRAPQPIKNYFTNNDSEFWCNKIDRLSESFLAQNTISQSIDLEVLKNNFKFIGLPTKGCSAEQLIEEIEHTVLPYSINTGSPYFIGHMTALLPNFMRPLSKLKSTLNQNMVKLETANSTTFYEKQALAMLHHSIYQMPQHNYKHWLNSNNSPLGVVTSGGTVANIMALQLARAQSLAHFGDVEALGMSDLLKKSGCERAVVIVSELGHYSIKKSLGILGLGKDNLICIPVDEHQRMKVSALKAELEQCKKQNIHVVAIVGLAGSTECGSFDPLDQIAELAQAFGHYFHVDGAWGGALVLSKRYRHLLKGIEQADSITIDGHKQLYLPIGTGLLLLKDPDGVSAIENQANYIIRRQSFDLGRFSIEGSRPASVFYLQAGLKLLGSEGYADVLDGNIDTAKRMAEQISQSNEFELLTSPQSNIFLYRYLPKSIRHKPHFTTDENHYIDSINTQLQNNQKAKGRSFVSRTLFKYKEGIEVVALRVVIANPLTNMTHCEEILEEQKQIMLDTAQAKENDLISER